MWLTRMTPVPFTVAPWDVLKVSISFSVTKNMIVMFKRQTRKPFDRDIQWRIQDFPEEGSTSKILLCRSAADICIGNQ